MASILEERELVPDTLEEVAMGALRQRMLEDLRLKGFQEHTRRCSIGYVQRFCDHYGVPASKLGEQQIRDYLYLEGEKAYSPAGGGRADPDTEAATAPARGPDQGRRRFGPRSLPARLWR